MSDVTGISSINKSIMIWLVCLIISIMIAACSEKQQQITEPTTPANFDEFVQTLPKWETYSPKLPDSDEPVGVTDTLDPEIIDSVEYNVTSTQYALTSTPEKMITLNPDVEILWVGSLLQGNGYKDGIGSLAELPIRQRAPLELSIDLLYPDNTRTVENPTVATVTQAIGELIGGAAGNYTAGSDIYYHMSKSYSASQAMLKVGASVKYSGANIKATLGANIKDKTRSVTVYFVQRMFTVSMVLPQNPKDLFSNEFTQDLLQQEVSSGRMGPDNPPVYVSSITYGRILMFTFTSTASEVNIQGTLNAIVARDTVGSLSAEYQAVLDSAQIEVVTVGGDAQHALNLIRSNSLGDFFSSDAAITTARPISYTVRNLKDNTIAQVSETAEYNLREYTAVSGDPTGAEYEIIFTTLKPKTLRLNHTAKVDYEFRVNDGSVGDQNVAWTDATQEIEKGQETGYQQIPQLNVSVKIHFDGTDKITVLKGWMTDKGGIINRTYTFDDDPLPYHFNPVVWQFGSSREPAQDDLMHIYGKDIDDTKGNTWHFSWTMKRVGFLYD